MPRLDKEKLGKAWGTLKNCHYYHANHQSDWHKYASASSLLRAIDDYLQVIEDYVNQPPPSAPQYNREERKFETQPEMTENLRVRARKLGQIVGREFVRAEAESQGREDLVILIRDELLLENAARLREEGEGRG